jgi:hypothetical protein
MDPLRVLTSECGFFSRQEAKAAGHADRDIARAVRRGAWVRFRRGAYAFADEWSLLSEVERHRVRANAVMRSLGDAVALSHVSGVVRHDIEVWGLPLGRVHVTRLDGGAGRIEGDVVHHEGLAVDEDVVRVRGQRVLRPERCVLEAGSRTTNEVALCLLDSGLRSGAYDLDTLWRRYDEMQFWPFMRHLHIPLRMADPRSGSIGESRGMWAFRAIGVPAPQPQFEVFHPTGELAGTCDWGWEEYGLLGEFDGRVKYGRLLKPGQEPGAVVFQEKVREDLLRELTGFGMIRFIWSDFSDLELMRSRLNRLLDRAS